MVVLINKSNKMKHNTKFCYLVILITIIGFTGCTKDQGPIIIKPEKKGNSTELKSFSQDIIPLFDLKCVDCHDDTHEKLDLRPCCAHDQLWSGGKNAPYIDTINPEQSTLYKMVQTEMPPSSPLQDYQCEIILEWIKQGAKNN